MVHGPETSGSLAAESDAFASLAAFSYPAHMILKGSMKMAKVPAFHSIKPNARNVHHDNDKCTEGNNIESYNRRSGTGGRPRGEQGSRLA